MKAYYKRRANRKRKRNNSKLLLKVSLCLLVIAIVCSGSYLLYLKIISSKAYNSFSTVSTTNLDGSNLTLNNVEMDITSPLLMIREVSNESHGLFGLITKSRNSSAGELLKSVNSGRVNFSKVANLVLYEITNEEYSLYSSDYLKVRYSNLNDGYLLEVNNKTRKSISVDYLYTGELCEKGTEGSSTLVLKSGLTQMFLDSSISVDNLARSLASYKK